VTNADIREIDTKPCIEFVTDVAWCKSLGVIEDIIATSSEANCIQIWKGKADGKFSEKAKINTDIQAWNVNWSPTGLLLAANCGEDQTKVYKEDANE
jgi:WD40 repeat protein